MPVREVAEAVSGNVRRIGPRGRGYALLQSLVIPVLPTIEAGLHTSQNSVTWVLTAYLLSAAIFTPIMGRLGDMHGKERLLVVTLVALTLGSLLAAVASSITLMIVARVIQASVVGSFPCPSAHP